MDLNILENPTLTAQFVADAVKENKNCSNHPRQFGCSCHQASLEEDLAWILNDDVDDDSSRHSDNSVF